MHTSAENLNKNKSKGNVITHSEWNAIVRAVGADRTLPGLHADEASISQPFFTTSKRRWFPIWSEIDVEPYSVFGCVYHDFEHTEEESKHLPHAFMELRMFGPSTEDDGLAPRDGVIFTNGATPIVVPEGADGVWAHCHAVDQYEPTYLRINRDLFISSTGGFTGQYFGPSYTGDGTVQIGRTGLVAVTRVGEQTSPANPPRWAWFMSSRAPAAMIGYTSGTISAAEFDASPPLFGAGLISALWRKGDVSNMQHVGPIEHADDDALGAPVLNGSFQRMFRVWSILPYSLPADTLVSAVDVVGVGLCIVQAHVNESFCEQVGPFVTSIDWLACSHTESELRVCINWLTREVELSLVEPE